MTLGYDELARQGENTLPASTSIETRAAEIGHLGGASRRMLSNSRTSLRRPSGDPLSDHRSEIVPKSVIRKHDAKKPAKEFTAAEVQALLDGAGVPMMAFILLGINCVYGPLDIARLKKADVDFKDQWIGKPRGKTGVSRGAWLWPETIAALHEAIEARPMTRNPKLDELAFLTRKRRPWAENGSESHPFTQAFRKLRLAVGIDRTWLDHYALRHTFATVAGDSRDQRGWARDCFTWTMPGS